MAAQQPQVTNQSPNTKRLIIVIVIVVVILIALYVMYRIFYGTPFGFKVYYKKEKDEFISFKDDTQDYSKRYYKGKNSKGVPILFRKDSVEEKQNKDNDILYIASKPLTVYTK